LWLVEDNSDVAGQIPGAGGAMEDEWLRIAKRLQAIASTGLFFTKDHHDRERYVEVAKIANQMLSMLGNVPVSRIHSLVSDFAKGYATPRVDVRGAVIRNDKVLLVRESTDGLWTLPGGYADVGLSPQENVVKEIWEEARIRVEVLGLYAIRHKAKHEYDPDARDFYKLFFACQPIDDVEPLPSGLETTDVGYFSYDELPPLSRGRVIEKDIDAAFRFRVNLDPAIACD
jgi:ADP-ribose pyrophosphatase YjhB (NUDIX family)